MKILLYADSPQVDTGFATVTKNLLRILKDHDVTVFATNHTGIFPPSNYKIIPSITAQEVLDGEMDVYGLKRLIKTVEGYDALITINDHFILGMVGEALRRACDRNGVKWFGYYPIDSEISPEWAHTISLADVPIFYCVYGQNEYLKHVQGKDGVVIFHGTDTETFFPMSKKEIAVARENFFGHAKGKKLIVNVNRNQPRKYIPETMMQFKRLLELRDDVHLYLHMRDNDMGYSLNKLAQWVGLPEGSWSCAAGSVPSNILNVVYNCADVFLTTHLGEGWGLTVTEAMATKTPVVVPDNTSMSEIVLGYKVKQDSWICLGNPDFSRIRPCGGDYVPALMEALDNPNKEYIEKNYEFVRYWSWELVGMEWNRVLSTAK
jgi:glycosyltransferase involved in cell wall biosynthesis